MRIEYAVGERNLGKKMSGGMMIKKEKLRGVIIKRKRGIRRRVGAEMKNLRTRSIARRN